MHAYTLAGLSGGLPAVFVMLAMRKSSHEERAALISRRHIAVKSRIQWVLTQ
jgi:hypothetical protein